MYLLEIDTLVESRPPLPRIETTLPEIEIHTLTHLDFQQGGRSWFPAGQSRFKAGWSRFQACQSRFPAGRSQFQAGRQNFCSNWVGLALIPHCDIPYQANK